MLVSRNFLADNGFFNFGIYVSVVEEMTLVKDQEEVLVKVLLFPLMISLMAMLFSMEVASPNTFLLSCTQQGTAGFIVDLFDSNIRL